MTATITGRRCTARVIGLSLLAGLAAALTGCSQHEAVPTMAISPLAAHSTVPSPIFALVGNENGLADLSKASPSEIRDYLDVQAAQSNETTADALYACRWKGQTACIPVFSSLGAAKLMVNKVFHAHASRKPHPTVVVMTAVGMNHSALYQRVAGASLAVVLDVGSPTERQLTADDIAGLQDGSSPQIVKRSMVWVSAKGSNVDKVNMN